MKRYKKPCVQRAAVDERLLVGESRATTLVSQMPPTSLAVSAEDAHGAPRADPSASVIQLIAARCDPADRFSSGVPALGESFSSNKSEQHIHINPATKSALRAMYRCSPGFFCLRNETNLHSWMHCLISSALQSLRRALYIAVYHKMQNIELKSWGGNKRTACMPP